MEPAPVAFRSSISASIASAAGAITPRWWRARRALRGVGARARRSRRHHGRRLRGMGDMRPGRAVARRHRLRHLSDRVGLRSRIPDAGRRRRVFIAENQEYVDKILPFADRLPDLRWIFVLDDAAMFAYRHPKLKLLRRTARRATRPDLGFGEDGRALNPDDPAFIVYTSGTTGHPKGALISHGKHLAATATIVEHYPTLAEKDHRTVVFLPLCHVFGRDVAVTLPLISRLVPHFGEEPDDLSRRCSRWRRRFVHRAALSAEIRLAGAGRHAQLLAASSA